MGREQPSGDPLPVVPPVTDRYEVQEVKDGWWVIRVPPKGRRQRLALYKKREQALAHQREAERGE